MRLTLTWALAGPLLFASSLVAGNPQTASPGAPQTNGPAFLGNPSHASAPEMGAEPDATVSLTGGTVAVGVGYVWANGELVYKGQTHKFKVRGVSVVDVGAAHLTASGVVYNLKSVEDFAGHYSALTAGATVGAGGSAAALQNEHGVVIRLLSQTSGLRFNLAANGINVKLSQ